MATWEGTDGGRAHTPAGVRGPPDLLTLQDLALDWPPGFRFESLSQGDAMFASIRRYTPKKNVTGLIAAVERLRNR